MDQGKSGWDFYTAKELKPLGWLKEQLRCQAMGLAGNLDRVWPDVRDSKWIGGEKEGWERVPYWLDGFIPLAYLLEDSEMIERAAHYVDAIIGFQKPDGWICPCEEEERKEYDTWPVLLISKVLKVYYDCSRDERIPGVLYRTLKNYYELLKEGSIKLFCWGEYRWFEGFIAIRFLYETYREDWIRELAGILHKQGKNYDECMEAWKRPLNQWTLGTHVVNLAMMLKAEAVSHDILGQEYRDLAEKYYQLIMEYNGTPVGLFTGDECLSGLSPIQGTELCAVVEQMYSYELLYAHTKDPKWAERLEVIAFNALPAALSDDMWAHQYVQMSNQIDCRRFPGRSLFRTNGADAHIFGLEPHFGCCTANFGQGWPKLALFAFLHDGNKIVNAMPVPSVLRTKLNLPEGEARISIRLETNYPFDHTFVYLIESDKEVVFPFQVRIPSYAKHVTYTGENAEMDRENLLFQVHVCGEKKISITYEVEAEWNMRPHSLRTAKWGPLIFSLPIQYEKIMYEYSEDGVERKYPYCDYEYQGTSDWNFGFADSALECLPLWKGGEPCSVGTVFSSQEPPVALKVRVRHIPWGLEEGFEHVCAKIPASNQGYGQVKEVLLYPYGCAKLRMTEMPMAT